jgi:hypothetical protein
MFGRARYLLLAVCALVLTGALSGCGSGSGSPSNRSASKPTSQLRPAAAAVATLSGKQILASALDHDLDMTTRSAFYELAHYRVPSGLFQNPSNTRPCISVGEMMLKRASATGTHGRTSPRALPSICRQLGHAMVLEALSTMLRGDWIAGEAAEYGAAAAPEEVNAQVTQWEAQFPTHSLRDAYLQAHGMTLADERQVVTERILSSSIVGLLSQFAGKANVNRSIDAMFARWTAKTVCAPQYLVEACRNYRPSRGAPSAGELIKELTGEAS